jgi:WD40 repeat protein
MNVKSEVLCLCLSEDGSRLYCGSDDILYKITVWDTATNTIISGVADFYGHHSMVTALCLSPKTKQLISASYDKTIRVWDTTTNKCIHTTNNNFPLWSLALSDNNDALYSAGTGNYVVAEWKFKHAFKRPSDLEIG